MDIRSANAVNYRRLSRSANSDIPSWTSPTQHKIFLMTIQHRLHGCSQMVSLDDSFLRYNIVWQALNFIRKKMLRRLPIGAYSSLTTKYCDTR
jgi:hypothetical protein